ncbi:MAG TPA: MBL fold metallo-hydrolase [Thermopetrobacter sp.]|nr:MBL fold metallo-hydrolase [Thermopetrobacter sp.]
MGAIDTTIDHAVDLNLKPEVTGFFDPDTFTISYVVKDPNSNHCAIIDPVLDYDAASGRTATTSADKLISFVRDNDLEVDWIIETHAHADHLSAAPYVREQLGGGRIAIGKPIGTVQKVFGKVFNDAKALSGKADEFDHLFEDGEEYRIGAMRAVALHTPGHTPACMTHVVGDAAFVGDTIFMPDVGTARADFPGGDAKTLYRSVKRILALPEQTRVFVCHDYPPEGREPAWETTVGEQRRANIHVKDGIGEDEFVKMREARDATLSLPRLIIPSIQVNIHAGQLPQAEDNGVRYLKVPLDLL